MAAAESSGGNAWVESYLDALLTYGLSSEYLKSTKEAKAKSKTQDADRSAYSRYYVNSLLNLDEQALHSAWSKASSATKQGGEKDARLQYLSWRIWHMRRRLAAVEQDQRGAEEESALTEDTAYTSDEEEQELTKAMSRGSLELRKLQRNKSKSRDQSPAGSEGRGKSGAAEVSFAKGGPASASGGVEGAPKSKLKVKVVGHTDAALETVFEDLVGSPASEKTPHAPLEHRTDRLYVILISLHGLVRGDKMELGRDSDTGGQVKYVVELAKALALHPSVFRVDLLTRLIKDPSVDASYGEPEECLVKGRGSLGGAFIVRLPCGPPTKYVSKELLWPYVREFADRGIAHATSTLAAIAESGRRCELYAVHGHYADAGEVAVLMSSSLDVHMVMTGHSLGRNKLEHLLASGSMTRSEIESAYAISRRIEAEERCLDNAMLVFTSTRQEVDEQWGLYDGYSPQLSRVLRFHRSFGRHMPNMKVIPPGLDFSSLKVTMPEDPTLREFEQARAAQDLLSPRAPHSSATTPRALTDAGAGSASGGTAPPTPTAAPPGTAAGQQSPGGGEALPPVAVPRLPADMMDPHGGPPIWKDISRFLRNPLKPAILAMSRPDHKKNLTTLVQAFGKHKMLRELANLVLVMGNRDNIDSMASGSQKVLTQVLKLIDSHDLYGSVAYPKHHTQADISDIYLFSYATRGVFVNPALQEPFGLTVIEAAAHGVPTVATKNGGPVDIMATLHHGVTVDPTDPDAVALALLRILTNPQTWDDMSGNGVKNIMAYSWPSHCKKYLEAIEAEKRVIKSHRKHDRTMSGLLNKRPAPPEKAKQQADENALGGGDSMTRYFTSPHIALDLNLDLSGGGMRKTISGMSSDDLAILQGADSEGMLRAGDVPLGQSRRSLVLVPLDSDYVLPEATGAISALLEGLESRGQRNDVGLGLLSMLGFESTCQHMEAAGIARDEFDLMVCNSGADLWLQVSGGRWEADELYEGQIAFEWDRILLHRMLTKIISKPQEDNRRLPRLKELLYNVQEEPAGGVHPRHICLELDPESQAILSAGMGPRSRATPAHIRTLAVVDRLKKRLRSKGMRASYNLQLVPREDEYLAVLHITPLRASRPLALRYLSQKLALQQDNVVVMALAPETTGSVEGGDLVAGSYCSDTQDLVGGMQQVCVVTGAPTREGRPPLPSGDILSQSLGVSMQPYLEGTSRVAVAASGEEAAAVLQLIEQQQHQGKETPAKAEA
ncbi:hypothetical protein D9Q98_001699 [Chlorella vulgaris]|uniref:sucrose-phosphate synthase n=1 Tax=Chlorella vulgaris TaxID=3077 RepID=A0A9D4TUU5_CHLVU|nr:hypothetical protein D9Q98_001699 [Chlorella vulgaris]